jgi:pyruvate kinase
MRKTRIVCTIGPASLKRTILEKMLIAGMDVARLNFSHGSHEQHAQTIALLRSLSARREKPLAILQDLSGPKVRLGKIACGTVPLRRGQQIVLTTRNVPGDHQEVPLPVPELIAALRPGDRLFADDGRVEMRVVEVSATDVLARTVVPGDLSSHKGVMSPGVSLDIPGVTSKDITDLRFGLEQGVDWVAASFIRKPEDLAPLREVMREMAIHRPIIAKIEKWEAVKRIEEIIACVQGVMVARGDLGVEIPIEEVPGVQKKIIRLCNRAGKPVITATQMLDSMIHNPLPTRAEVTDVANAILDGTDAVMLSGETAAGQYPLESVRMMAKIAQETEPQVPDRAAFSDIRPGRAEAAEVVAQGAVEMARALRAAAIICATTSGSTARLIAKYRPDTPVIALTHQSDTFRRLALTWGVRPLLIERVTDTDEMMEKSIAAIVEKKIVRNGDLVVLTAGVPVNIIGNTNLIRVHTIGQPIRTR